MATFRTDLERAEELVRRATRIAQEQGMSAEELDQLWGMLGVFSLTRRDESSAQGSFERYGARLDDAGRAAVDDRAELVRRFTSGDLDALRILAERLVSAPHGPDDADVTMVADSMLLLLDTMSGQAGNAQERLARLTAPGAAGDPFTALALDAMMPLYQALAAQAAGDLAGFERELGVLHDRTLASGAGPMAARVLGMLAIADIERRRPRAALERLLPALLASRARLSDLPSSAEREAYRTSLAGVATTAVALVAGLPDARLLTELLETLRTQGLPLTEEAATADAPPIAALLAGFSPQVPGMPDGTWREQASLLPVAPLVVLPWGTVALARHHDEAARYAPELADARRVRLVVPR